MKVQDNSNHEGPSCVLLGYMYLFDRVTLDTDAILLKKNGTVIPYMYVTYV